MPNVRYAHKLFWTHQIVLLGDVGKRKLISVYLEIVLNSAQDRCMVCAECTMAMQIILGTPDGIPS
jgi:hypothetical protein